MVVVEDLAELRSYYGKLRRLNRFWAAVSGALFREIGLVVSGAACRARYDLVMAEAAEQAQATAPNHATADRPWFRVAALADRLGLSQKTIRNRATAGKIEKQRIGSTVWVRPIQPDQHPADSPTLAAVLAEITALRRAVEALRSESRQQQTSRRGTAPLLAALPSPEGKA